MLLQLHPEENLVLLTMHHVVADGWSVGVLVREMAVLYAVYAAGMPSPLPELYVQYADYAVWQRQWLQGEVLEGMLSYWREQLTGLPPTALPTDHPRLPVQTFRGGKTGFRLPTSLAGALRELAFREGVTLFMTLLVGFQLLLSRYSGRSDIAVGSPIANRNRREIEGLIGFFVNMLVLRIRLTDDPVVRKALQRSRDACLGAYTHQDLPFEKLVEDQKPERDLSREPLFQVVFALQNVPLPMVEIPGGLALIPFDFGWQATKYDLSLVMTDGGLSGSMEYSTNLFDSTTVVRMLGHYQRLLEGMVSGPRERVSELSLLGREERHQVLVEWTSTGRRYGGEGCVQELVERQGEERGRDSG